MRQNANVLTGNVLILKVGYALKCEIVLHRGGKNQRCKGFFFLLKNSKTETFYTARKRKAPVKQIPLLLLLNSHDFMKTLFGADTTNLLTCFRILKFCNESIYDLFF